jgi:hypothetical protein
MLCAWLLLRCCNGAFTLCIFPTFTEWYSVAIALVGESDLDVKTIDALNLGCVPLFALSAPFDFAINIENST